MNKKREQKETEKFKRLKGEYRDIAQVFRVLDNGRFEAKFFSGWRRGDLLACRIPDDQMHKVSIVPGDIILIDDYDWRIIDKYSYNEAKLLKMGELPDDVQLNYN